METALAEVLREAAKEVEEADHLLQEQEAEWRAKDWAVGLILNLVFQGGAVLSRGCLFLVF